MLTIYPCSDFLRASCALRRGLHGAVAGEAVLQIRDGRGGGGGLGDMPWVLVPYDDTAGASGLRTERPRLPLRLMPWRAPGGRGVLGLACDGPANYRPGRAAHLQ